MDFKRLVNPLSEYYGLENIEKAIKTLKIWYEDEAYDDDDIIADWHPEAFEDSEGIDKLVESLNYAELLNNNENKKALYTHCLYHLLPDQSVPTIPLLKHILSAEEPLEQLQQQFKNKLIEKLYLDPTDAQSVADVFLNHVEEQEYDIEGIEDDLANQDESEIIENIMNGFPKLKDRTTNIFNILSSLTSPNKSKINDDISLQMVSTTQQEDEAVALCKQYLLGMFQDKNSKNVEEKSFIKSKSWDISNQFPWLSCMVDTFSRYRLESHHKLCQENKDNTPNISDIFMDLKPNEWFEKVDPNTKKLMEKDKTKANIFKHGMMALLNRLSPIMILNYKVSHTIWDSLDVFARYSIAMNQFIYNVSNSDELQCTPIQFDFMIIPQCASEPMYQDTQINTDDLYAFVPDFLKSQQTESKKTEIEVKYTCFGRNDQSTGYIEGSDDDDDDDDYKGAMNGGNKDSFNGSIWDLEDNLKISEYICGVDYIGPIMQIRGDEMNINRVSQVFNEKMFKEIKGAESTRYRRYIIMIDRRDPINIKKKEMKYNENKRWEDRMYIICPKKGDNICSEYQYKMNETFMQNTKQFILPMRSNDFGGLESGNGYRFLLSFHVHSKEKVKMYWYLNGGSQRFFMDDIEWLWYRFFVKQNDAFQTLKENTKEELQRVQKEYPLIDKQFMSYRNGYKLVN